MQKDWMQNIYNLSFYQLSLRFHFKFIFQFINFIFQQINYNNIFVTIFTYFIIKKKETEIYLIKTFHQIFQNLEYIVKIFNI